MYFTYVSSFLTCQVVSLNPASAVGFIFCDKFIPSQEKLQKYIRINL
jgi:hypothetical protein